MTVTYRTDATEQEFRDRIAPFEDAPIPPEVVEAAVLEEVARAMWAVDDVVGSPLLPWDDEDTDRIVYRKFAAAAVAAYRATQDGGAEEAVRREAMQLGALRHGYLMDDVSAAAALAPQAGVDR